LAADPFPYFLNTTISLEIHDLNTVTMMGLILIFLLTFLSILVSGSDTSFFSLNSHDLNDISDIDKKKEKQIRGLISDPKKLFATIFLAKNFTNALIIVLSFFLLNNIFDFYSSLIIQFFFQVIIITFIVVFLFQITPKFYAKQNAVSFSIRTCSLVKFLYFIFSPISSFLINSSSFIDKRLKQKSLDISIEELSQALDFSRDEDKLKEEKKILKSIIDFGNIDVREIMKPRVDVISLEKNASFQEVLSLVVSSPYSRIPVYQNSFDNIHGVLYIKDLIPYISSKKIDWSSLCHEPLFVPETRKINDLLKEFQEKKIHLAFVVDEYGGTSGIVTLEDVLEEIVGEINDEFDDDGTQHSKLDDNNYIFEAKTSLNDFLKVVEGETDYFDNIKGDTDTIAGIIIEKTGTIPKKLEKVEFPPYTFFIESADDRKINKVKVQIDR
tara:strand:- start:62 stop:1384 length:1323 start_codon:yes stop_codon:yes gene_type:complete